MARGYVARSRLDGGACQGYAAPLCGCTRVCHSVDVP